MGTLCESVKSRLKLLLSLGALLVSVVLFFALRYEVLEVAAIIGTFGYFSIALLILCLQGKKTLTRSQKKV